MRKFFLLLSLSALCLLSYAQQSAQDFLQRYNTLTGRVGPDGVGVETLLNNWEEAFPDDVNMLKAKWKFYFNKAQSTTLEMMDKDKYLGEGPALALKDSLGNDVNYFQKTVFDDEMFGQATQALDRAVKIQPDDLELHIGKIHGLIIYEGESPDMASDALRSLIDYNYLSNRPGHMPGSLLRSKILRMPSRSAAIRSIKLALPLPSRLSGRLPRRWSTTNARTWCSRMT